MAVIGRDARLGIKEEMIEKLLSLACALGLLTSPLAADGAQRGQILFERHCATCHGMDLSGQGPMWGVLMIKPTDLAGLTEREGDFPLDRVITRTDG